MTVIMAMSSCSFFEGDKTQGKQQEKSSTIEGFPLEIKNKIAAQDTLMKELVSKVDTLAEALSQAQQENAKLKAQVEDLKSPKSTWAYVSMGAFALGLIALIISLFRAKGVKEERGHEIFNNKCIGDSGMEQQEKVKNSKCTQQNSRTNQSNTSHAPDIDSRLSKLENRMSKLENQPQVSMNINKMTTSVQPMIQPRSDAPKLHKDAEYQKVGYAKNDTATYFTTIYESNQEGCVFKITFTSPTNGVFNIISLDKIQSRNDWQQKIECSGISIKEASDFQVEEEGLCEKIEADTWQVTKPLKIRLRK